MILIGTLLSALILDHLLGEPRRFHPLVGFGHLALTLEARLNPPDRRGRRGAGLAALLLLVLPLTLLVALVPISPEGAVLLDVTLLYLAIGRRSLTEHALAVRSALDDDQLIEARRRTGYLVSRDTGQMTQEAAARATIESILENGNDALFGVLFWFLLAGAPGVVAYRLINTLDAMWGYRTERFNGFGWAAARLDDLLNGPPARLTALSYLLAGDRKKGWHCWQTQAKTWEGPNPGIVMAAGAGALNLTLGGADHYHGTLKERPTLGGGQPPKTEDIGRAVRLVHRALGLWVLAVILLVILRKGIWSLA